MKFKQIFTVVLLLFVAGSVVAVVVRQGRRDLPQDDGAAAETLPAKVAPASPTPADENEKAPPESTRKVIVYFFHTDYRCPTCRNIEAYALDAVHDGFAAEIGRGRLDWRVVNYEQPQHEHFAKDYKLVSPAAAVVLVKMDGDQQKNWKNLVEVWDLVADQTAFTFFMQDQIKTLLEEE